MEQTNNENGLRLHTKYCDKMYRWVIWRISLNEEISRAITKKDGQRHRSNAASRVTETYILRHDAGTHGRQMKQLSLPPKSDASINVLSVLPDRDYLVYGLPRVRLPTKVPVDVKELHDSSREMDAFLSRNVSDTYSNSETSASLSSSSQTESQNIADDLHHIKAKSKPETDDTQPSEEEIVKPSNARVSKPRVNANGTINPIAVNKSRMFWERLAGRKNEIISLNKTENHKFEDIPKSKSHTNTNNCLVSNDILQQQQRLLKKTNKTRSSKDLWQTVADRKREIAEMNGGLNKKDQSKSHLWGFIFSKKKDLLHMKRTGVKQDDVNRKNNVSDKQVNSGNPFQRELAERLRKRRIDPDN
ncbi:hypothetical protein DPMN_082784 [Dreissena polymorpha]|uniref:Uncharacterized protein n=1 Tax=Dreissena polymorpha TaxID=45954 RepID=A0A9D3YBE0_DREPO|nr:hypothetical protein DPMN_082784 [Dreissena polymorpha]